MKADFSGYASKNGLKCADGRTIQPGAFKEQDGQRVPLVWSHQHDSVENILGHAILENRDAGVYAYGFFNDTAAGLSAKESVKHGDITAMSIYANKLVQKGPNVIHGAIREVSLVMAGANPGAIIENVYLQHSDEGDDTYEGEVVIKHGLGFESINADPDPEPVIQHENKETSHMAGTAEKTVDDVFNELNDEQKNVVYFMIGAALEEAEGDDDVEHGYFDLDELKHDLEGHFVTRNIFETFGSNAGGSGASNAPTLSHDQIQTILKDAQRNGSFKESFLAHAQEYGIENIDILFPDAKAVSNAPEVIGRRTEWVNDVINGTRHSPFSRIKSTAVDLTADEARAKGYVKGNLKKEEIIKLLKRVTTPTTIYKKQKLDRDDILDITDLNVVAWLKAEMRLMLDEEIARAVLIGDGRESDDEDKIDEDHIRPIARDVDMYAHAITVASDLGPKSVIEAILRARRYYKGTGVPTLYTTDEILTDLILDTDKVGRRLYETEEALAAALRVRKIVTVEVMTDAPDILGIIVNLADYTIGTDAGGNVSMFDDFDIDYNQYKYLIETRISGALTKPKSALVIKRTLGTIVTPSSPSFDGQTNTITFPATTGVIYSIEGADKTGTLVINETTDVDARPAAGYQFPANTTRDWTYLPTTA